MAGNDKEIKVFIDENDPIAKGRDTFNTAWDAASADDFYGRLYGRTLEDTDWSVLESGMRLAHEYKGANDNGDGVERNACGDAINPETGLPKVNLDQAFKF